MAMPAATGAQVTVPAMLQTTGIDHVGLNVPDMDSAISFFAELLGTKVVRDIRPGQPSADWKRSISWRESSRLERLVMLQAPTGDRFELFEYHGPEVVQQLPHTDDAGATHIAFRVPDIEAGLAFVRRHGLRVLHEPVTNDDGTRWFYFLTPWGSPLELVASPSPQP